MDLPMVTTAQGPVRGRWITPTCAAFKSIPVAEPPTGPNRFAAPVPRRLWSDPLDALEYGPTPQRRPLAEVTAIPEPSIPGDDTLTLSVFTPSPGDPDAGHPVFVWIHGGGFTGGSPASPWYDGSRLSDDGIVTVVLSYRLGLDGFGSFDGAPDNRAVSDWLLALEWVRDTIADFGGDPSRVTIGGQSAGGSAVLSLLSCPQATDLFTQAISHSAVTSLPTVDAARSTARALAEILGVDADRDGFASVSETQILDAQDALAASGTDGQSLAMLHTLLTGGGSMMPFGPVTGTFLLPEAIVPALAAGRGGAKPLLIGTVAEEFNAISAQLPPALDFLPPTMLVRRLGFSSALGRAYRAHYRGRSTRALLGQLMTDAVFRIPLTRVAAAHTGPVFTFDFRWPSPAAGGLSPHCLDLPFAWNCLDAVQVDQNTGLHPPRTLAREMHSGWVRFITTGDPGWAPYASPDFRTRTFADPIRDGGGYQLERQCADELR